MLSGKFKHPWRESIWCSLTELEMLILKMNKRSCSVLIMKIEAEEVKTKQQGLDLYPLLISGEKKINTNKFDEKHENNLLITLFL